MARSEVLHDHPRSKKKREEVQEAKKGDRRTEDFEQQDGQRRVEFKGEYESIGMENMPEGHPDKIDPKDMKEMSEDIDAHRKGGSKGPTPSFKAVPSDEDRKNNGEEYEHWRLRKKREIPTS